MTTRPIAIISGILCFSLAIYLFVLARSTIAFAFAKWTFRNSPEIWMVPTKPLLSEAVLHSPATKLAYFGYEFESPTVNAKEKRGFESAIVLSFSDCAGMTIFKPQPAGYLIQAVQQEASKEGRDLKSVFGSGATNSDCALRSKILNVTPGELHFFSSPRDTIGTSVLLAIKNIERERFKNGLYSFDSLWMRGFQEGDLSRDRGVVIEAFDRQDRELMLIVAARPGKACFSQSDLNGIIFSLKPIASD